MRAVIQRVKHAKVTVDGTVVGEIGTGMLALLGVEQGDCETDADYIIKKLSTIRIFEDGDGKMNLSLADIGGEILIISQFTLAGDARHGRRPSFSDAAAPDDALPLYNYTADELSKSFPVARGVFGADMDVELVNQGPVTLLLDSRKRF